MSHVRSLRKISFLIPEAETGFSSGVEVIKIGQQAQKCVQGWKEGSGSCVLNPPPSLLDKNLLCKTINYHKFDTKRETTSIQHQLLTVDWYTTRPGKHVCVVLYLIKIDASVRFWTVAYTELKSKGTRNPRPCITDHPVE